MPPLLAVPAVAGGGALAGSGFAISGTTAAWIVGSAAVTAGAVVYGDDIVDGISGAMSNAQTEAESRSQAVPITRAVTCARCAQNPCAYLACGVYGLSRYRGGAHGCMTGTPETKFDGLDSHHMPARSLSPLNPNVGPAIQMDPVDHQRTASYGSRVHGASYALQRGLLSSGQTYAAFLADALDARMIATQLGDPTKYDAAIAQATAYASCLKSNGLMN